MRRPPEGHALLDLEMRRRLAGLVAAYPGLHVREAARQLNTSMALVEYHLALLLDAGLVETRRDDRYVRIYPVTGPRPTGAERDLLALLRERLPLSVTLFLLDRGEPVKHGEVADALRLGKSKLSFHLRKLEAAGIVAKTVHGEFVVLQPKRVQRLLWTYQPTPDLRQEFADVWLSLYGD
jgi:DNA-binding transcriptional ArsR family regulator